MTRMPFLALAACLVASVPAAAQTVQVVVLADESSPGDPALWEALVEGCLDALFETGVIATNARPAAAPLDGFLGFEPGPANVGEYVDLVLLVFASFGRSGDAAMPPACRYRVLRPGSAPDLGSGELPAAQPASTGAEEVRRACRATGAAVAAAAFADGGS